MKLKKSDGTIIASEVERADSFLKQAVGLMFRKQIPESYAMLFDMGYEQIMSIHMLFVFFPIDVVYLDKERRIVDVRTRLRPWIGLSWPRKPSQYVIEMPAGTADRFGLKAGEKLEWQD